MTVPGYLDLQVNGAAGIDLTTEPERVWEVAEVLPRFGVTRFLPTLVSGAPDLIDRARQALVAGPPSRGAGARPLGWHFEGPMINPVRRGAHDRASIRRLGPEEVAGWSPPSGVAMVTLAPELSGAPAIVRALASNGVVVCAGHTDADAITLHAAVNAGLRGVTHLFNAMRPLHHREPGAAGATLTHRDLMASLIADGRHVASDVFRLAWDALGPGRRILVSDAVCPLGMPPGRYRLGKIELLWDGVEVRTRGGALAGTALGLDAMVRTAAAMTGCALADVIPAVTAAPARLLGLPVSKVPPGPSDDAVVLDADGNVLETRIAGEVVFCGERP
jgi:N-acetylglucosamine-6-phosphate deacetylase